MPETGNQTASQGEETLEVTIPNDNEGSTPVYTGDEDLPGFVPPDDGKEKPADGGKSQQKSESEEADETDYKKLYEQEKARYEEVARYSGILERMKNDESLVKVLEDHIYQRSPEADATRQQQQAYDDDFWGEMEPAEGGQPEGAKRPDPLQKVYTEDEVRAIKAQAAAEAEMKKEVDNVLRFLVENGVPEEVQNEFVAFVNNPSGVTGMDLLSVFESVKRRAGAPIELNPHKEKKPGGTIAEIPGGSDKPASGRYLSQENAEGSNYKADPNNL